MASCSDDKQDLEGIPLDLMQRKINTKNGVQATVSAIHIGFKENRFYIPFQYPPVINDSGQDNQAELEEWLESSTFIEEDLHWLLKLPHHRFWSQVVYEEDMHNFLETYLTHAPRLYDIKNLRLTPEVSKVLETIHKLVFLVFLRMSTYKESRQHYLTPKGFGDILYDNYVFDVPRIMDLCVLYGFENSALVNRMVENIFTTQPKYLEDLNTTSQAVLEALTAIEEKLSTILNVSRSSSNMIQNSEFFASFHDIVNYITDVSITLYIFLEVYSPACNAFFQNGATLRIATFYEQIFPVIEKEITKLKYIREARGILEDIKSKVILSKTFLAKLFRNILNYCCIDPIITSCATTSNNMSLNSDIDQFLDIFTILGRDKHFLKDYNNLYPFEKDVELFTELNLELNSDKLNYIFLSVHDTGDIASDNLVPTITNDTQSTSRRKRQKEYNTAYALDNMEASTSADHLKFNQMPDSEVSSLISSVQDVLTDFGDGFIEKCLLHYHYDAERVIDAILTNMLPDQLACIDPNLKREVSTYSVLSDRKNIYDNDEFDFFQRDDVNMDNVHIGKKNKTPSGYESLKHEEDSDFLKHLTLTYSEDTEFDDRNLYDDEYDDTYDSAMFGLKEPAPEGEPESESVNDLKTEKDNSPDQKRDSSKDFCVNPEIMREKYAQRREAQRSRRPGGGPSSDAPHSRQNKDRNKAYVGNHNRRKQADFKRSRGMGPL